MQKIAKSVLLLLALFALFVSPAYAEEQDTAEQAEINAELDRLLSELDLSELNGYYNSDLLGGEGLRDALSTLSREGLT